MKFPHIEWINGILQLSYAQMALKVFQLSPPHHDCSMSQARNSRLDPSAPSCGTSHDIAINIHVREKQHEHWIFASKSKSSRMCHVAEKWVFGEQMQRKDGIGDRRAGNNETTRMREEEKWFPGLSAPASLRSLNFTNEEIFPIWPETFIDFDFRWMQMRIFAFRFPFRFFFLYCFSICRNVVSMGNSFSECSSLVDVDRICRQSTRWAFEKCFFLPQVERQKVVMTSNVVTLKTCNQTTPRWLSSRRRCLHLVDLRWQNRLKCDRTRAW